MSRVGYTGSVSEHLEVLLLELLFIIFDILVILLLLLVVVRVIEWWILEPTKDLDLVYIFLEQWDHSWVLVADWCHLRGKDLHYLTVSHLLVVVRVHYVQQGVNVFRQLF
jgi:hypothetical protein